MMIFKIPSRSRGTAALALTLCCWMGARALAGTPSGARPGDDVQAAYLMALQQALPAHGYPAGPPTGRLDPATEQGLRAYQRDAHLPEDTQHASALKVTLDRITYAPPPVSAAETRPPEKPAPPDGPATPADASAAVQGAVEVPVVDDASIRLVQEGLRAKGFDLARTGTLDAETETAIKAFQAENNLPTDGRIDGYLLDLLKR